MMALSTGDISEGTSKFDYAFVSKTRTVQCVMKGSRIVGRVQELAGKPDSGDLYRRERRIRGGLRAQDYTTHQWQGRKQIDLH